MNQERRRGWEAEGARMTRSSVFGGTLISRIHGSADDADDVSAVEAVDQEDTTPQVLAEEDMLAAFRTSRFSHGNTLPRGPLELSTALRFRRTLECNRFGARGHAVFAAPAARAGRSPVDDNDTAVRSVPSTTGPAGAPPSPTARSIPTRPPGPATSLQPAPASNPRRRTRPPPEAQCTAPAPGTDRSNH